MDYPLLGVMYAHAHAMYTRPPFPQEMRPGIEASTAHLNLQYAG